MARAWKWLLPPLLLLAAGGAWWWFRPREPVESSLETLEPGQLVRVRGTARYDVRVELHLPATWFREEQTRWVFPLFPKGDTTSREIRWLVLGLHEPDPILGLEDVELVARVHRPTTRYLNRQTLDAFRSEGYEFADDFLVLEEQPGPGSR